MWPISVGVSDVRSRRVREMLPPAAAVPFELDATRSAFRDICTPGDSDRGASRAPGPVYNATIHSWH